MGAIASKKKKAASSPANPTDPASKKKDDKKSTDPANPTDSTSKKEEEERKSTDPVNPVDPAPKKEEEKKVSDPPNPVDATKPADPVPKKEEPEKKSHCCPIGSEPRLAFNYTAIGTNEKLGDLPIYTVGQGDKAIICIYDIFGSDAGRTKLICDQLADAGFFVILPDFFRGDPWTSDDFSNVAEWMGKYPFSKLNEDLTNHVYPYLEAKKIKSIGMVGFCWGVYVVFQACASGKISAGVGFHPTLDKFPESAEQLAENVKCPQMLLPAGNDPDIIKEGGAVEKVLKAKPFGDKVQIKTFPDMNHGWVPRGDLSKSEVARDVKQAMELAVEYLKQNV